jgi:selenide, water dikinase
LAKVLSQLPESNHPDLLIGFGTADDAGVFRLNDSVALVQTLDFFPPIVDDPYAFGRIAAANALSDIYAMGGKPLTAMNIVAFPSDTMPAEVLTEVLRGGKDAVDEAGAVIVGGHSIKDKEIKYGLSITGIVHPDKIVANAGARPGDVLFLTKPLGTGIIATGLKRGMVSKFLEAKFVTQMATLNRKASELMLACQVHGATDITGFGFLGHACEMAIASGVTLVVFANKVPLIHEALPFAEAGIVPGGLTANREYLESKVMIDASVNEHLATILFDPQTSGGLLTSIPAEFADVFEKGLADGGIGGARIGTVENRQSHSVHIV